MKSRYALVIIVIAELFGGSLWFSVNAIADTLYRNGVITTVDIGHLTSAVQFGFIVGTLFLALSGLADRYSASRIFAICAIAGAVANAAFISVESDFTRALILRFVTGVTLAGIYPIAMKLIISWSPDKAGAGARLAGGHTRIGHRLAAFHSRYGCDTNMASGDDDHFVAHSGGRGNGVVARRWAAPW